MKVAHLVHLYPPEFRGGTEVVVQQLTAAQRARGDQPLVIAGSNERVPGGELRLEAVDHVPVCRVLRDPAENYSVAHRCPRVVAQVLEVLAHEAPDLVHLHHGLTLSGDLAAALAAAGHVVVTHLHDYTTVCARSFLTRPDGSSCAEHLPPPPERCRECVLPDFPAPDPASAARQLDHELADKAGMAAAEAAAWSRAIVPSTVVEQRWRRVGLPLEAHRLVRLPHAAPLAAAEPPAPRSRADGRLVLGTWGHLAPAKGLLDLLEALRLAADPRLQLMILGEPVDADFAGRLLDAAEGLDVTFGGRYDTADLLEVGARLDLAVFPSRAEETFGLVVAEARALGLPVITSDRGALPESLGLAGVSVPAADPRALAAALRRAADEPATLEAWRAAARSDLLDPAAHAERLAELYAEALADPAPAHVPAPPGAAP